ncbi:hypothetical protein E2C01_077341 [Portunus trituberculatus]|uniref:Uncharacterized protein n=1 Tax=Portunus trituberculatus TaxID=210409 RepID=A0A5B7IK31_PORTR|nr:hypothetical protein [Portunus trituberculatus]
MASLLDKNVLNFEDYGFYMLTFKKGDEFIKFRTKVKCREDFERWKEVLLFKTNMCFNSYKLYPCIRKVFHQQLIYHHGTKHLGVKKTSTGIHSSQSGDLGERHPLARLG